VRISFLPGPGRLALAAAATFAIALSAGCAAREVVVVRSSKGSTPHRTAAPSNIIELADARRSALSSFAGSPVVPVSAHAPAPAAARPERISVLSFNMQHRRREAELAVMAKHLRTELAEVPDFILLQEVRFFSRGVDGVRDTASMLARTLAYHCQATCRTSDPEGVAIASRYPFDYYAERHLGAQTSPLLLGFNRVSVMGEFLVAGVGRVRVVNTHLTNWDFEAHVRTAQLRETLEWMARREAAVHADVTIFGGDLNFEPHWDEMGLIETAGRTVGVALEDYNSDGPSHGAPGRPRHRVDYIFIASPRRVRMLGEQRLWLAGLPEPDGDGRFWPSDHVPVLHEYLVGPTARPAATLTTAERLEPRRVIFSN
jgi:endonuclease/exonuclease/phosphatase family metal-dependent hydrolase